MAWFDNIYSSYRGVECYELTTGRKCTLKISKFQVFAHIFRFRMGCDGMFWSVKVLWAWLERPWLSFRLNGFHLYLDTVNRGVCFIDGGLCARSV